VVVVRSGAEDTGMDAVEWAREAVRRGAGEILLTSFDRDGTRSGYDLELLQAVSEAVPVPVIASGGGSTPEHMAEAFRAGADAVLAASIFHFGEYTVARLKSEVRAVLASAAAAPPRSYAAAAAAPATPTETSAASEGSVRVAPALLRDVPRPAPSWSPRNVQCLVPSIDIRGGHAVQLVGGDMDALKVDAGDPVPLAHKFKRVGEIAVVDLDAALGRGSNEELIKKLVKIAPCRVGGGIRSADKALDWLQAGAAKVVLGTAARPDVLRQLPRERVVVALDARHGEVVVEGWTTRTGASVVDRIRELKPYAANFLVTFVEREGRMQGIDLEAVRELVDALGGEGQLTVAGGVTTAEDLAALDALGVEGQVGMALYTGHMALADGFAAAARSDRPDGLVPTVVVDEGRRALGLAYSSQESLRAAVESGLGVYHSRRRGLWVKGKTSGNTQQLLKVELDCDRDTLLFVVRQSGEGFCHRGTEACFGAAGGLPALERTVRARLASAPPGSYTRRLLDDPALLRAKLVEEGAELAEAEEREHAAAELADVLYFALVAAQRRGATLADAERVLDERALRVQRRRGDAKPAVVRALAAKDEAAGGKKAASGKAAAGAEGAPPSWASLAAAAATGAAVTGVAIGALALLRKSS